MKMGIKIWWQDILPSADRSVVGGDANVQKQMESKLLEGARKVARQDTAIEVHHVKYSSYAFNASYLEMLNNVWIIDGIIEAETAGYDAAIIGCGNDPGLQEARQAVDIPVIGCTEAAMLLSCSLGSKFSVITVMDEFIPVCEKNIRNYGLGTRAAGPVKVYQMGNNPFKALFDMVENPASINPQFENLCHECIESGAEVIIPACASLSPATTLLGYNRVPGTGVPVIDITQAAVKLAETLVDLKRSAGLGKSQKNTYKSIPSKLRDRMRAAANCVEKSNP
jgi:allantoin racemase